MNSEQSTNSLCTGVRPAKNMGAEVYWVSYQASRESYIAMSLMPATTIIHLTPSQSHGCSNKKGNISNYVLIHWSAVGHFNESDKTCSYNQKDTKESAKTIL
jgi:hypothetical protein